MIVVGGRVDAVKGVRRGLEAVPPENLDKIVGVVLAHEPRSKSTANKVKRTSPTSSRTNDSKGKKRNATGNPLDPRHNFMTATEEISVLANSLSFWEYAAYLSISAVAVGVAEEVVHDFTSWFKGIRWWAEKGSKYSAVLLVIALFAELIIQIKENSINGRITAILEHETAIANERTAEIEKMTAWRKIEPATAQKLSAALGAIPPTVPHKVVFSYAQNDPEALYLTVQIGRLFLANKKRDADIFAETHPGILYWDVRVLGPDNDTTRAVRRAFETAGIAFSTEAVPGGFQSYGYMPKPEDTVIQVGPKKPPFEP